MTASMDSRATAELKAVLAQYDLGELVEYERNERGFVNTSYALCMLAGGERKRYFLRKYKRGAAEEELLFEHSLIEHLVAAGAPVARIHHTRQGKSYLHTLEAGGDPAGTFYTIFDYLPGDDRYTWIDPVLTEGEQRSSANVLAEFHADCCEFTPLGKRAEPKILELLPVIAETWTAAPGKSKGTIFDDRIREQFAAVNACVEETLAALCEPAARALPQMLIHCDY